MGQCNLVYFDIINWKLNMTLRHVSCSRFSRSPGEEVDVVKGKKRPRFGQVQLYANVILVTMLLKIRAKFPATKSLDLLFGKFGTRRNYVLAVFTRNDACISNVVVPTKSF